MYEKAFDCGNMFRPNRQAKIIDFVKKAYRNYFGVTQEDKNKPFATHVCYKKMCGEIEILEEA